MTFFDTEPESRPAAVYKQRQEPESRPAAVYKQREVPPCPTNPTGQNKQHILYLKQQEARQQTRITALESELTRLREETALMEAEMSLARTDMAKMVELLQSIVQSINTRRV